MCGRFALSTNTIEFKKYFELARPFEFNPHWNITPGRQIAAIRHNPKSERVCDKLKWGLVPFWAKDEKIAYKLANARGETVAEKPSFREAFKHRRCLILASGFYEWDPGTKPKQPYYVSLNSGEPMGFAGLWESWTNPETKETLETCCIVTTQSNELMTGTVHHDRMPVILHKRDWDDWLGIKDNKDAPLQSLIKSFPSKAMQAWKVSTRVNKPDVDDEALIRPLAVLVQS